MSRDDEHNTCDDLALATQLQAQDHPTHSETIVSTSDTSFFQSAYSWPVYSSIQYIHTGKGKLKILRKLSGNIYRMV